MPGCIQFLRKTFWLTAKLEGAGQPKLMEEAEEAEWRMNF